MSKIFKLTIVASIVHLSGFASSAWSQVVQTSLLTGRVFDSSGAVIQQAEVDLRGPLLLEGERRTMTDDWGRYRFPALLPGVYRVTVSFPGFSAVERGDILVEVGAGRVVDFTLPVGPTTEAVTVAERVPAVDVRATSTPTYLDQNLLNNLPVTRVLDDLINLAPGVTRGVGFGGTQSSNAIYINGVQTTDPQHQDPLVGLNHNWLEQMEVVALGASAEYGGFTGVAANAIVRSGSNRFSGLGEYWTTRPGWLSDNSPFEPREILSLWESSGQVGGPIVEDRVWFFAGTEFSRVEDRPALYSGPGSTAHDRHGLITRLDAALTPDAHLEGLYRYAHSDSTGVGLGPVWALEATSDVLDTNHLWNTRLSWVLSGPTLMEARTGGYARRLSTDPRPPNSRAGPPGVLSNNPQFVSVNAIGFGDNDRSRADAAVSLTRYTVLAGQPHDLKAGLEFEATSSTDRQGTPGGMFFLEQRIRVARIWDGEVDEATSRRGTAYVRDQWSVGDRVTLDLGVRLDINRASVPVQGAIFSTNPVSPRAGVAWAVTGDYDTVIRAHYGRYHDSILTRQVSDLDTSDQNPTILAFERPDGPSCEAFGLVARLDGQLCEFVRIPPEAVNTTIDEGIQHSYVNQYVVGIEREVVPDVSVQIQYVRRNFERFMGSIGTNTVWTPQEVLDPGPDGSPDTEDDGGPVVIFRGSTEGERRFLYTNPEGAFRRYDAIQLIGTKRYSDNWQMQASYTWSRSRATVGNAERTNAGLKDLSGSRAGLEPTVFSDQNGLINAEGTAPLDVSELKILGTYRVPAWGGFNVSGVYRYHSGGTWARTFLTPDFFPVRAEPRGSRRLPPIASLDLRVEKTLDGFGGRLGLFVDAFNVTNEGTATHVNSQSGPGFGESIAWTDPRTIRAGLRYQF